MNKTNILILVAFLMSITGLKAQNQEDKMQFYRSPGYDGLNVFETSKDNSVDFDGMKVRLGGDFALQFQSLSHSNTNSVGFPLRPVASNINLPTANLNIDVQLHEGLRMHLRTFLSSRHHNETWVKGGYMQIDKLDFIKDGFASSIMDNLSFRVGMDQLNYGDAHYRRSDNAMAIYNPFVGNYIMDAYTTEPFLEANVHFSDFLVVGGLSNGMLHPTVAYDSELAEGAITAYGKLGYDSQINDDLRVRLTASVYSAPGRDNGNHLYSGDRSGSRYYDVLDFIDTTSGSVKSNFRTGRLNPGFKEETAFQINPFVKFKGLEFFGIYEVASGNSGADTVVNGSYTQLGAELLYRFGSWEQFYVGGRYNSVSGFGEYAEGSAEPTARKTDRINFGGGWFMTKNTLMKVEYVSQSYDDNFSGALTGANFKGLVFEAVISF
jgi:hypothetical protein